MIQQNELRIGNWVQSPLGDFAKVKQLGHPHIFGYIYAFGENYFGQGEFKGIPLTTEILEKAGFKRDSDYDGLYCFGGYNFYLTDGVVVCLVNLEYKIGQPVHYLHQLQNFIYALTGEELNIEL